MFYVSWSHKFDKLDLGKTDLECAKCQSQQQFTVRLYTDKTKLYGIATIRKKRFVTLVCHGCLTEFESSDAYQTEIIKRYDDAIKADKEAAKKAKEAQS